MKKLFILLVIAQLFAISCSSSEEQNLNPINVVDDVKIEMVTIPAGIYTRITNVVNKETFNFMPFKMSKYEITVSQYIHFLNQKSILADNTYIWNTSYYGINFSNNVWSYDSKYANYPIGNVTALGASECAKFYGGKLPNSLMWEYACMGSNIGKFYTGDCLNNDQANYQWEYPVSNSCINNITVSIGEATEVGSFTPNQFGLYDMYGNVNEICSDDKYEFVSKGGGFYSPAIACSHLWNNKFYGDKSITNGFRIVIL